MYRGQLDHGALISSSEERLCRQAESQREDHLALVSNDGLSQDRTVRVEDLL